MPKKGRKKGFGQRHNDGMDDDHSHSAETALCETVREASLFNKPAMLEKFLQESTSARKLNINEKDSIGMSALQFACVMGKLPLVKLLVEYGADVNTQDSLGFTPLFQATGRYPNVEIARYLVEEAKAAVDIYTPTGASVLHGCALQGNIECLKVLLRNGADPRHVTEDGTTPLDLAKDEQTKAILHKALRKKDEKTEKEDSTCSWCCALPKKTSDLKRCAKCRITLYCSKECQVKDWKEGNHKQNCQGFVLVKPKETGPPVRSLINHQKMRVYGPNELKNEGVGFLQNKQFVVKIQVPLGLGDGAMHDMIVYNEDRSISGFIPPETVGYRSLRKYIEREGFMGLKAYFWAELTDATDGTFKVFHGKSAPFQQW